MSTKHFRKVILGLQAENARLESRLWAALYERDTLAAKVRNRHIEPSDEQWQGYSDMEAQP